MTTSDIEKSCAAPAASRRRPARAAVLFAVALAAFLPFHAQAESGSEADSRPKPAASPPDSEGRDLPASAPESKPGEQDSDEIVIPLYLVEKTSTPPPASAPLQAAPPSPGVSGAVARHAQDLSAPQPMAPASQDYVIGPQDLIEVTVLNADALNRTVRVSDDGSITLPLVGEIVAAGKSQKELERIIATTLDRDFVKDAQVSIFVREAVSKRVSIIGAVRNPGGYELRGRRTLLEVLSQAGGIIPDMSVDRIVILRRTPDGTISIPVDLDALVVRADAGADVELLPGDIVNVPVENFVEIYVNGSVRRPSVYKVKISEPVTLLQVITMAGGVSDAGSERRVQIMRRVDGEPRMISVNLKKVRQGRSPDPPLQKGDVVIVPEARF